MDEGEVWGMTKKERASRAALVDKVLKTYELLLAQCDETEKKLNSVEEAKRANAYCYGLIIGQLEWLRGEK